MKIIFIRHGETNIKTGTLTRKGVKQIKSAAKYLKDEKISAIYCSPTTRTLQTANILNKTFKKPLFILKELNERQQLNSSHSISMHKIFNENYLNYDFESEDFETCKNFIDRNISGLEKIRKKYRTEKTIIIAAHSSTLYAINTYATGIPANNKITWLQCSNGAVIKFHL
ncbi:MAG: histidine phosphatase family protein [Clostridia bacterium]|nr:histidine phosphatase family protein [Clostridia bacterium]